MSSFVPAADAARRWFHDAGRALALCVVAGLGACSPALDWRDVYPQGTTLLLQMPCRPSMQKRSVALAGAPVPMTLYVCSTGGQTWGLAYADVVDPARVGPALITLRDSAAANIGTRVEGALSALLLPGATPNDQTGRTGLAGRLPDGEAVQMHLAVFVHGTQVFQATALGPQLSDAAVDTFLSSIRFGTTR